MPVSDIHLLKPKIMKRGSMIAMAALLVCGSLQAQDIYKIEALSGSDLNGTARFVGMGGAMSALGADLSTMSNNPAAIGLYRRSDVAFTGSATIQPNGISMGDIDKARGSFDQAGFVYAAKLGDGKFKYVNFGFNYQKRRNLKNTISLNGIATANGESQSWQMQEMAYYNGRPLDLSVGSEDVNYTSPLTITGYDAQMIAPVYENGKLAGYEASNSAAYNYNRVQWGGIQQYDFNLSFNYNDCLYAGLTLGVYNVDIHSRLAYDELLVDGQGGEGVYNMDNYEDLSGMGVDVKFGLIYRPEYSPFRIGFSFSTPTFYYLTHNAYLRMVSPYGYTDDKGNQYDQTTADWEVGDYDYNIRTPWKLGLSVATTVGQSLALDAEYEVSRYTGAQVRYPDYDTYWGEVAPSTRDKHMDTEIDNHLKTVQTFRIGAELRMASNVFLRAGYNYVSSPFKKSAWLNTFTASPSYAYSTNTDYVNLGDINRVTAGLGYKGKHFYADLAYQYQAQKGDVYAFNATDGQSDANVLQGQKVDLNRHNVMVTLGYKF